MEEILDDIIFVIHKQHGSFNIRQHVFVSFSPGIP